MSPVVEIDDVSPRVRTGDVERIWYCGSGVSGVLKTQHCVLFICCVRYEDGKSQKVCAVKVGII